MYKVKMNNAKDEHIIVIEFVKKFQKFTATLQVYVNVPAIVRLYVRRGMDAKQHVNREASVIQLKRHKNDVLIYLKSVLMPAARVY
jgi:hypothetical protein